MGHVRISWKEGRRWQPGSTQEESQVRQPLEEHGEGRWAARPPEWSGWPSFGEDAAGLLPKCYIKALQGLERTVGLLKRPQPWSVCFLGTCICRSPASLVILTWENNRVRGLFLSLKHGEPPHCNKVVKLLQSRCQVPPLRDRSWRIPVPCWPHPFSFLINDFCSGCYRGCIWAVVHKTGSQ